MRRILSVRRQESLWPSVILLLLIAALLAFGSAPAGFAQTITTFDVTGATNGTFAAAINLSGTVAGEWIDASFDFHGFLRTPDGTITSFDPTFCNIGSVVVIGSSAINNPGAVIGFCTQGVVQVGFLRDPMGNFTEIAPPLSTATTPSSINDGGEVAGSYNDSSLPTKTHGFVRDSLGNYTSFDVPGGTYAEDHFGIDIVSINSGGQVAGFYFVNSFTANGFLRDPNGTITTFPAPGAGDRLQATSMNDTAAITGFYTPDNSTFHGFLQQGGTTTSFDVAGETQTLPQSINLSGTMVGFAGSGFNNDIGFVRDPLGAITTFVVPTADNTQPDSVNDLGVVAGIWLGPSPSFNRHGFIAVFTAPAPPSSGTTCNGTYNGTFRGNVTVLAGQTCNFIGGGISGNVASTGGTLGLSGATVGGNVQITGGTFSLGPSTTIKGNLTISNLPSPSRQSQVCGTTVQGDLQFQNNGTAVQIGSATPASCAGNTVGGNLEVHNNTGPATIVGNTVAGNLQVQNNTAPTQVFNNTVTQNLQCQNNSSITGGGNTARQKQGQCAAF